MFSNFHIITQTHQTLAIHTSMGVNQGYESSYNRTKRKNRLIFSKNKPILHPFIHFCQTLTPWKSP